MNKGFDSVPLQSREIWTVIDRRSRRIHRRMGQLLRLVCGGIGMLQAFEQVSEEGNFYVRKDLCCERASCLAARDWSALCVVVHGP